MSTAVASMSERGALQDAVGVLDQLLGDTDGDDVASCPQHGPPAFRACFALSQLLRDDATAPRCMCGEGQPIVLSDDAAEAVRAWQAQCSSPVADDDPANDWPMGAGPALCSAMRGATVIPLSDLLPLLRASVAWLHHLETHGRGRYLDGVPGEMMDAADALPPALRQLIEEPSDG